MSRTSACDLPLARDCAVMRAASDGESTVPGQIALQRMPRDTKSAATALVRPITAALLAPYTNRLGTPFTLPATDAMLTIEPPPCSSMPGRKARIVRAIARALRLND